MRVLAAAAIAAIVAMWSYGSVLQSSDLYRLRSVSDAQISPDGKHVAYVVDRNEREGRPVSRIAILDLVSNKTTTLGDRTSSPLWSPDGQWLAFSGKEGDRSGLMIARADGSGTRFLYETRSTNAPLPEQGRSVAWSPDSKSIAFVSATPGPETAEASGDPVVIRRYVYKPTYTEGISRFNDNRRLHIFLCDVASGRVRQLTDGPHYEHSVDFAPDGSEVVFVSNREADEDQFFNYDVFAVRVADGTLRRISSTESAEYVPQFSPDGKQLVFLATKRGLTDRETTMEDTHVWTMNADGSNRREIGTVDNRQSDPRWSHDGKWIYFGLVERGDVHLMRVPSAGGASETVVGGSGRVNAYSTSNDGVVAYAFLSTNDLGQLYVDRKQITSLNEAVLHDVPIAPTESFMFESNDNRWTVEAFLTRPNGMTETSKHPMIVVIHGGPHFAQGSNFNFRHQVYAGRGYAVLMVNYRGSTGYGQKFADAVFGDQNGNEAQDVLYGVSAALRRNLWIDRDRLGIEGVSYGGQLTNWLITQTRIFKAAIPTASIVNLVSYNYTTYYNQYEQMTFGILPHQGDLMDELWRRSALRYVAQVATPTLIAHGENDSDVPIMEAEQFYIALKDVGVETVMARYPREGHGLREPRHVVDLLDRSIAWYESHWPRDAQR